MLNLLASILFFNFSTPAGSLQVTLIQANNGGDQVRVEDVIVELVDSDSKRLSSLLSDDEGLAFFETVPSGEYSVMTFKDGYCDGVLVDVAITASQVNFVEMVVFPTHIDGNYDYPIEFLDVVVKYSADPHFRSNCHTGFAPLIFTKRVIAQTPPGMTKDELPEFIKLNAIFCGDGRIIDIRLSKHEKKWPVEMISSARRALMQHEFLPASYCSSNEDVRITCKVFFKRPNKKSNSIDESNKPANHAQ